MTASDNNRACIAKSGKMRYNNPIKNEGENSTENKVADVPYIVHEAEMARMERVNKRWFWAWLVTFVLLAACVAGFSWYEAQWQTVETITQEVTQESADGINHFVGGDYYGAATGKNYTN